MDITCLNESIHIADVIIPGRLILAPMAGVTDLPFRILCKEQGAAMVCTEMVSAKGIYYKNKNTDELLETDDAERPVALQLFGSDPDIMGEMTAKVAQMSFDIIDINMGCPVSKVVKNGEGSAMLKDIPLAAKVMESTVKAAEKVGKPVTVKIRKGFSARKEEGLELAKAAESVGISAIAVHARTREDYYSGEADWDFIKKICDTVSVPVIGNGDVKNAYDAVKMMDETGCEAVMIGRAARGNPWVFDTDRYGISKEDGARYRPSYEEMCEMLLRHAHMEIERLGEDRAMKMMRTHFAWYTAGYKGALSLRRRMNEIVTYEDLINLLTHTGACISY